MNQLFDLIGHLWPESTTAFRIKVLAGGVGGFGFGLVFMTSGIEGTLLWGAAIAACGLALMGMVAWGWMREARKRQSERIAARKKEAAEACRQS